MGKFNTLGQMRSMETNITPKNYFKASSIICGILLLVVPLFSIRTQAYNFDVSFINDEKWGFGWNYLPFCQRKDQFITFRDVNSGGSGLQHKSTDFKKACEVAIALNRTLIDYTAKYLKRHAKNKEGKPLNMKGDFVLGWRFGNIFNLSRRVYTIRNRDGAEKKCRFSFSEMDPSELDGNLITIDYANVGVQCKTCNYRINDVQLPIKHMADFTGRQSLAEVKMTSSDKEFSQFFKTAALHVRKYLLSKAEKKDIHLRREITKKKFVVIHIRGTDRPCALRVLTPEKLKERIESFGVDRQAHVVYIMTDLDASSRHMLLLKRHFKNYYLYTASDVELFDKEPFSNTGQYLVYVTELQLQAISDGFINTYYRGNMNNTKNFLGYLAPNC